MSTLKVNNIQTASGGSNSTPEQIEQGRAKVWVCFNGTGTVSIRDSFNTSSITDNGTGSYTINFSTALSNTNFCTSGLGSDAQTQFGAYMMDSSSNSSYTRTTGSVSVYTLSSQSLLDTTFTNVVVHGDE
tara:strand:+ start:1276 stop:1665 length:390 start_codon:yes stop_codon:yes gene_type:complete